MTSTYKSDPMGQRTNVHDMESGTKAYNGSLGTNCESC